MPIRMRHLAAAAVLAVLATGATAAEPDPYSALEPLVGEWDVGPAGGPPAFVERFTWGPGRGYLWMSVSLLRGAEPEHLHFEGPIIWNASTRRFDYLFAVEPGSLTQERGEIRVDPDGSIVRDVVLTDAKGTIANFRQTFRPLGDGRFESTLMREAAEGWQPTFPGSDRLAMVRRAGGG